MREAAMVERRKRARTPTNTEQESDNEDTDSSKTTEVSGYEQFREQRIKENMQRMQKLGILDLSYKLKSEVTHPKRLKKDPSHQKLPIQLSLSGSPRRSSRLKSVTPVSYLELRFKKKGKSEKNRAIHLREGSNPEIYTEEHDKLLGECTTNWTLFVDSYGKDGKRIYDQVKGKTCHQCRQKTLGLHTQCSKCNLVQGQFCGDCLFMRYGENVMEANQNPGWICPVCRGICNCSLCRQAKGWVPTGSLYRKVSELGFKSVAHYLIQTKRSQSSLKDSGAETLVSAESSSPIENLEAVPSLHNELMHFDEGPGGLLEPQANGREDDEMREEKEEMCGLDGKVIDISGADEIGDGNAAVL